MPEDRILIDHLFRLIEKNDLPGVKKLFQSYPSLILNKKNLRAQNGWGPDLFSARFGYTSMLKFFFTNIYKNRTTKISDLILLNIHSGSLKTMYFLQNQTDHFKASDLKHYYINSCKLDKSKLSLYFLLRGAFIMDNHAVNSNSPELFRYHNIYCVKDESKIGGILFYDMKGKEVMKKEVIETTLRDVQLNLKIVRHFILFNSKLLEELERRKVEEYEGKRSKWFKVMGLLKKSKYLSDRVKIYL